MENKNFQAGTVGEFASNLLEEYKSADGKQLSYVFKKTDEIKRILDAQEARGGNIKIGSADMETVVKSMTLNAAIQAYQANDTEVMLNPLSGVPITDFETIISLDKSNTFTVETAPSKAISASVALITQGTLSSTKVISNSSKKQTNNRASIKDSLNRQDLPVFSAKEESYKDGIVNKRHDISDVSICSHLDWNNLFDYGTLNDLITSARRASENQTVITYTNYGMKCPDDDKMFLTALRLQNRALEDSIFEEVYMLTFPEPNISDPENYARFIELKKRFHSNLSTIGQGNNISASTVQVGISRMDVVTSVAQTVSSTKRINSVKQNKVNSYVHTKPVDTGLCTAVISSDEAKVKFMNGFCFDWTKVASLWLQNESRHFLHLPTIAIPDEYKAKIMIEKPSNHSAYDLLKISSHSLAELEDSFIAACYELADKVIKNEQIRVDTEIYQVIHGMKH